MKNNDSTTALDEALEHVSSNRRDFLKQLLAGAAVVATLPLISSEAAAQPWGSGYYGKGGGYYYGKGDGYYGKGDGYYGKGSGYYGKGGGY